jgi:P-type Cu+ transporter
MESAAVALIKGGLRGIVRARHLGRATVPNIRQGLFFAFIFNAPGGRSRSRPACSTPWFALLLNPMIASAAMSASSVPVIANSLRLRRVAL